MVENEKINGVVDYNEKVKNVNAYILKFNQMIMGFAIGIIAFSIQGLQKNSNYLFMYILYISWISLAITFFIGLIRMHHQLKVMTRNVAEAFDTGVLKKTYLLDEKKLTKTNRKSGLLYKIMLFFFCLGLICYGIFKIMNINS